MNIEDLLRELDGYYQRDEHAKIEPFLRGHLDAAMAGGDFSTAITILNELIGFYRGMSRFRDSLEMATQAVALMDRMGYKGSVPYATTLLNVATAYRADGQTDKAIGIYEEVAAIYKAHNLADPYLLASLYNNFSLAWQEAGEHEKAIGYLDLALPLIASRAGSEVEIAVTRTNRALSEIRCGRLPAAREDLAAALALFESQSQMNSHYGAALAAMGEVAYREHRVQDAIGFYERALAEILPHYGRNMYYAVTLESLAVVCEEVDPERSRALGHEARQIQSSLS